jgi:hypothetical protein
MLLQKVGKDKHGLQDCDADLKEKMNYPSVERLWKQKVVYLLEQHVPGMRVYLIICNFCVQIITGSDATRLFL